MNKTADKHNLFYFCVENLKETETVFSHILLKKGLHFYMPPYEHIISFSQAKTPSGQRIRKLNPKYDCFDFINNTNKPQIGYNIKVNK
jgi:hypothetical protein